MKTTTTALGLLAVVALVGTASAAPYILGTGLVNIYPGNGIPSIGGDEFAATDAFANVEVTSSDGYVAGFEGDWYAGADYAGTYFLACGSAKEAVVPGADTLVVFVDNGAFSLLDCGEPGGIAGEITVVWTAE